MLINDIRRTYDLIPGDKFKKIIGCYRVPGVHAVITYRFGQWLMQQNIILRALLTPIYLFQNYRIKSNWGIEIPRTTEIAEGLYIGHFGGITISHAAKIGKNLSISQLVTIGVAGQGEKRGCPIIGDNVYIGPGAKLFGKIKVGDNVRIGANAVVYKDIPDNATVVLDPGFKILKSNRDNTDIAHAEILQTNLL